MKTDDRGGTEMYVRITCYEEEIRWFEKAFVRSKEDTKETTKHVYQEKTTMQGGGRKDYLGTLPMLWAEVLHYSMYVLFPVTLSTTV